MSEIIAELNAKIPAEPKNINLHLNGFDIRFDYGFFSNKSVVIMFHGVSIKMEGLDWAMQLGFNEKETFRGPSPFVSLFMANM